MDGARHRRFVGTSCEKKGIRQLVAAMPAILAAHPDARLLVAGRDWADADGSFRARLEAGLDPTTAAHVEFLGPVDHDEVPALLARAAVCAYPSHMEAMPWRGWRALAMGRAVVAGDIGPAPEVVEDGVTGVLCDPYDPAAIAAAVGACSATRRRARLRRAAARAHAEAESSITALVRRNEEWYERCRGGPWRGAPADPHHRLVGPTTWEGRLVTSPYVREIDLWGHLFERVVIVGPTESTRPTGTASRLRRPPSSCDRCRPPVATASARSSRQLLLRCSWRGVPRPLQGDAAHVHCPGTRGPARGVPRALLRAAAWWPSTPASGTGSRARSGRCASSGRCCRRGGGGDP